MKRHSVTLTEQVSDLVGAQVVNGRYKDFSAAVNELLWSSLAGSDAVFREYGVTADEVDLAFNKVERQVETDRKAGRLREFKP
jgi:Arc/MetJ-type ribon-helix-helix transcriptional regulator